MGVFVLLLALAVSVKDGAQLRKGCDDGSGIIAELPAGSPVTIRFALAGEATPCYKVAVEIAGRTTDGYLPGSALNGLDSFEQARRDAPWLPVTPTAPPASSSSPSAPADPALLQTIVYLIQGSQPAQALSLIEPELARHKNPDLLSLAGVAALHMDDSRKALDYWKSALDLRPNNDLETLYRRIDREVKSDRSTEKLFGMRVSLRYESPAITVETARQMVAALDQEYARISGQLGCAGGERIAAIAQSRESYRKTTESEEWNGGQFDGRIRVPVYNGLNFDPALRRILAHEITHACLSTLGVWPSWLQEGLAQKLSGETVTPALRQKLALWGRENKLPRLSNLRQDWSRLDSQHAAAAYALSLSAVELLYENYGSDGVRNLLKNPDRVPAVTADLDKRLGL